MTYYRNNIQHLFVLPSFIASLVLHHEAIELNLVLDAVKKFYPFLANELFLNIPEERLQQYLLSIIDELCRQEILKRHENILTINKKRGRSLQLLAAGVREILQRYFITLSLLKAEPNKARAELEKESQSIAQRLSVLHGINAPEFFDKAVFSAFINGLKQNGYFDAEGNVNNEKLDQLLSIYTK
ncbi:hypothetical protein INT80_11075 [Gallibacterium anatis]|uniref:GPAT/DHAPAT C-terminal domain-containing protein n=1 Tax=Gallibacterium anatis TaxID=750 RepID=A0A930UT64_9PAST|nr:hypothetical protein [Gallibacterium anatis]